ncbi:putative DNA repair protein Nse1 [Sarocladium strictum]
MERAVDQSYGAGNRAFLQALMAHGALSFKDAQPIVAAILTADNKGDPEIRPDQVQEEDFQSFIEVASRAASHFDYEIRTAEHQIKKRRIWALVNTASDPQTQLATTFNAEELAFINRVLEAMFDTYNRPRMEVLAITEMQAIKLARPKRRQSTQASAEESTQSVADRGLKHSEVEMVLASLVDGGWFEKSRDGFYSLTPRGLLELRPWLVETFNDPDSEPSEWQRIKFCEACKELVTAGRRCSEPDCTFRIHDICEEAFWRTRRETKCPKCTREWTGEHYIGERAVTSTDAYKRGRQRSGGRRSTLADEVIRQHVDEDEEDVEEEEE